MAARLNANPLCPKELWSMNEWDAETAEWYAKKYGDYATNLLGVKDLNLASDSTVVDIGCGTGCALRHASNQVTSGTLIGIDRVPRMVEIAREQTANHIAFDRIMFFEGSAEDLPVKDASVDFVFAFDSFDHWDDQAQGLKETRRILKSSGRLIVVKDGSLGNGSKAKKALKLALDKAGFEVVDENDIEEGDVKCTRWICSVKN